MYKNAILKMSIHLSGSFNYVLTQGAWKKQRQRNTHHPCYCYQSFHNDIKAKIIYLLTPKKEWVIEKHKGALTRKPKRPFLKSYVFH
jgi:hypothetical protein